MSSTDPANVEPAKPPDEDIVSLDHYEILRLGPQADEETIERVYRTLAGRFHSNGPGTDDAAVLLRIRKAYETLSNPDKRARYNVLRQRVRGSARFRLRDREFFDGVRGEQNRRLAVLCLLYRQRVAESPGLTLLDLEQTTGCTREELGPALWYLCEKKLAKFGEGSDYRITAAGFDIVESKLEERDAAKLWAWLYPEDTGDNEFIYASARPTQATAPSHQTVEVMPESPVSKTGANTATAPEKQNSQPVAEPGQTDIKAEETPAPAERNLAALVCDEPAARQAMDLVEDPAPAQGIDEGPIPIEDAPGFTKQVAKFADGADSSITAAGFDLVASQHEERDATQSWAWLYPEDTGGNEFVSPTERPTQLAAQSQQTVPVPVSNTAAAAAQAEIKAERPPSAEAEVAEISPVADSATPDHLAPAESTLAALVGDEPIARPAIALVEDPAPAERITQEPIPLEEGPGIAKPVVTSEDAGEPSVTAAGFEMVESNPVVALEQPELPALAESTLAALVRDEPAAGVAMDLVEDPGPAEQIAQGQIPIEDAPRLAKHHRRGFRNRREGLALARRHRQQRIRRYEGETNATGREKQNSRPVTKAAQADIKARESSGGEAEEAEIFPAAAPAQPEPPSPAESALAALVRDEPMARLAMDLVEDPAAQGPIPVEEDDAESGITANGFEVIERAWSDSEDNGNELVSPEEIPTQPAPLMPESPIQSPQRLTEEVAALVRDEPTAGLAMNLVEDPAAQGSIAVEEDDAESGITANGFEVIERAWSDSEDNGNELVSPEEIPTQPAPLMPESPIQSPQRLTEEVTVLVQNEPTAGLAMDLVEDPVAPGPIPIEQDDAESGITANGFEIIERAWSDSEDANSNELVSPNERPTQPPAQSQETVPVMPESAISSIDTAPEEQNPQQVGEEVAALIHDESAAGLATDLVEDPAPAEPVAQEPIPVEEAPAVTRPVAVSLEAADEKSNVNSDPKPASIEIEPDLGNAEQAGLALEPPTMPTVMETIPSTMPDMAPEDADGKGTGVRAPLRAFSAALRERLTAQRLLVTRTISARRAQAKEKRMLRARQREDSKPPLADDRRFQSASRRDQGKAAVTGRSRFEKRMEVAVVLLAVSTVGALFFHFYEQSLERSQRYQIPTPGPAAAEYPALSPDGHHLAFVARKDGPSQLWVLAMDTLESQALSETSGASYPFWSPDGAYLGFFTHGKLRKIAIAGGPPQTLCDASGGRGGTWNRNDVILFSPGPAQPLFSVSASGGVPTRVTKLAPNGGSGVGHRFPVFLPDGLHFLYTAGSNQPDGSGVFVGSLDGAAAVRLLTENTNAIYAPPPKPGGTAELLFRREKTLMAQPFDANGLRIAGNVFPVAEQVQDGGNAGFGAFSVSENGLLAFRSVGAAANGDQSAGTDRTGTGVDASPVSPDKKTATAEPITVVTNWYRSLSP